MATTIRIGALEGFRDFVFELGTDPAPVLEKAGIDEHLWQTPNVQIPSTVFRTAIRPQAWAPILIDRAIAVVHANCWLLQ